jgi:hypothetical protein
MAWRSLDMTRVQGDPKEAGTAVRGAAAAGLTVVGILVPLSVLAVTLRANPANRPLSTAVLVDLFIGAVWLFLSLVCGFFVLWLPGMRAYEQKNVMSDRSVGAPRFPAVFLLVGVFRQVWGLADLVSSLLR